MKKIVLLSLMAMMLVGMVGCGANTPKQVLQEVLTNSNNMEAYGFDLDFSLSLDSDSNDPDVAYAASVLNNLELSAQGKYDQTLERFETIITATLDGDMKISLDIPVIFVDNTLYVKVPSIPLFPMPETVVGKYIELDLDALEEEAAALGNQNVNLDVEVIESLVLEIMEVVIDDFGDSTFITELKGEAVPSGLEETKHVIQLKVTDSTLEELFQTLIETTMPKVFDILTKEEYVEALEIDVDSIEEAKSELSTSELDELFAELRESFILGEASLTLGIDQDHYISHQNMVLSGTIKDEVNASFDLNLNSRYYDINEEQQFELSIPTGDEILTIDELVQSFMFGSMGMDINEMDYDLNGLYDEDIYLDENFDFENFDYEGFDFEDFDFENFDFENFDQEAFEKELGL